MMRLTLSAVAGVVFATTLQAGSLPLAVGGRLTDATGAPVTGPVELSLKFYNVAADGSPLGAVDDPGVGLTDGVFQAPVVLDAATTQAVFGAGGPVYVEVTDVTHAKTYPRQQFNAVPFALHVPVDGTTITYANGQLTVPAAPTPPSASATSAGFLATSDWVQFNSAPAKTYVDTLNTAQIAAVAGLSTNLTTSLTTTNNNVTTLSSAALKKDGSVALTNSWNVGGQDITNAGNLLMAGSKVLGLSVATSDPANLVASDIGKIWYNGGIKLWNGTSAQSLGIAGAGLMAINSLNSGTQTLSNAVTGTTPAWNSAGSTHTLNIPMANASGAVTAGLVSNAEWVLFNGKQNVLPAANAVTNGYLAGGDWTLFNAKQPLLPPGSLIANGYLASGDWAIFNAKQNALGAATGGGLGYLTAGDWTAFNGKDPYVTPGTTLQYYRGDKTWQTLATAAVAESTNLYYTTTRAQADARSAVGASAPLQYNAGTGAVSLPPATFVANGYLASADWAAFNAKQSAGSYVATTRNVNTNAPLTGGGALSADLTLNLAPATIGANGYLTSTDWAAFNAKDLARVTGNLTETTSAVLSITGGTGAVIGGGATIAVTKSGAAANGYLGSGDWLTFNGKQPNLGYAPVNRAGDTMTGILNLPPNGLALGTSQLVAVNGNVGIGTTNPTSPLAIAAAPGGAYNVADQLAVNATADSWKTLIVERGGGTANPVALSLGVSQASLYTEIQSSQSGVGFGTPLVLQRQGGSVGIGTTNPLSKLDVTGVATIRNDDAAATPGQLLITGQANTSKQLVFGYNTAANYGSIQAVFQGTAMEPLVLNGAGGNVGIGSSTPAATLDVQGNVKMFGARSPVYAGNLTTGSTAVYGPATSDGILTVYGTEDGAAGYGHLYVYCDTNNPPTTWVAHGWSYNNGTAYEGSISLMVPVRKGEYYQLVCPTGCGGGAYVSTYAFFVPLGH